MQQNVDNKTELKDKLIIFFNKNRLKIYFFVGTLIICLFSITFWQINNEKKNNLIAEKYIKAGLYLVSGDKTKSKVLYEEIILSKNKIYSILALHTTLEKNLIKNKNKILDYFEIIEDIKKPQDQADLIAFKKALYLIKNSDRKAGNQLLKNLIETDSKLSIIAKEALNQ
jgi:hypothetical protein|tara:strand:+ start:319 stop:828 length:510 start_codon:yes stop_codon:yes gene_type:complete